MIAGRCEGCRRAGTVRWMGTLLCGTCALIALGTRPQKFYAQHYEGGPS